MSFGRLADVIVDCDDGRLNEKKVQGQGSRRKEISLTAAWNSRQDPGSFHTSIFGSSYTNFIHFKTQNSITEQSTAVLDPISLLSLRKPKPKAS